MRIQSWLTIVAVAFLAISIQTGCGSEDNTGTDTGTDTGSDTGTDTGTDTGDDDTYATVIQPIWDASCAGCHTGPYKNTFDNQWATLKYNFFSWFNTH